MSGWPPRPETAPSRWRWWLVTLAAWTAVGAVAPRLTGEILSPARLRGRKLMLYVAFDTGLRFAVVQVLVPALKRQMQRHEAETAEITADLTRRLGRPPRADEIGSEWVRRWEPSA